MLDRPARQHERPPAPSPEAVASALPPTHSVFDGDVFALDIAVIIQALAKCGQNNVRKRARLAVEEPNHRHRGLLRPRRYRPRRRRAAEERDEVASVHSITSSAVYHGGPSCPQISVLMLCSLITGPQSFIWSSRNLRCASGPPICIVISIASMRLLIADSRR